MLDTGGGGCLDERTVLGDPVRGLCSGDHQQRLHPLQRSECGGCVAVVGDGCVGVGEPRCAGEVADQ
jgi:hypothetical protein